ncbi:O-antigen ligase family protein [Roseospira navarrensis]|nr:O-antigen ligase family protein [Roseospira navarrensis]
MPVRSSHITSLLPFALALMPLPAVIVAGAFASASIAVVILGGLWLAWVDRARLMLAGQLALLAATGVMALTYPGKPTEGVLFAATALCALAWPRLLDHLSARTLTGARVVFVASAVLLPVLLLVRALYLHAEIIPPFSLAPDMLAKPTFLAMPLVPAAVLLLVRWRFCTPLAAAFTSFMAIMAVGSASSTATLGFALGAAAVLAAYRRPWAGFGVAAGVLLLPLALSLAVQIAGVTDWSQVWLRGSWIHRLDLWQRALILFQQAPWTGHGFDTYAHIQGAVDMGTLTFEHVGRNHAHSAAMQLLAEGGAPALLALFGLLALLAFPPGRPRADRLREAARLGTLAAAVTPPAIGLNLWSDFTTMLVMYPLLAFALFVPARPDALSPGRGGTAPAPAASPG